MFYHRFLRTDHAMEAAKKLHHVWVREMRASMWATENLDICRDLEFEFHYGDGYTGSGYIKISIPTEFGSQQVHLRLSSDKEGNLQGVPVTADTREPLDEVPF